jgi:hypothetical protein
VASCKQIRVSEAAEGFLVKPRGAAFCTIVTPDWLPEALSLFLSLARFHNEDFHALVASMDLVDLTAPADCLKGNGYGFSLLRLEDLDYHDDDFTSHRSRCRRWAADDDADPLDLLRWSSKPVLIRHLLSHYSRVVYFDPDVYIVKSCSFLLRYLLKFGVLLTPHWRCLTPHDGCELYEMNYSGGLFNAGFVGFSNCGIEALQYWSRACKLYVGRQNNCYDDQRYLDLLPAYFDDVKVVRHRGCNVATWNRHFNPRSVIDGEVYVSKAYPLIFVHFSNFNFTADPHLQALYSEYQQSLAFCRELLSPALA